MKGLLLRLSQLDAEAENAVRVIGFFDRLITGRASLDMVVRQAAALAECPVGVSSPGLGMSLTAEPGAEPRPSSVVPPGADRQLLEGGTVVWVARAGTPMPLDGILLERFAIAVAVRLDHGSVPQPQLGDPALMELVLTRHVGTAERSRALHLLKLDPAAELRILATTDTPTVEGRATRLGSVWAVLCTRAVPDPALDGGRIGVGPWVSGTEAARSWVAARTALRFATTSEPVVYWDRLGCLEVLASRLGHTDFDRVADLSALDRLAAEPCGAHLLALLEALCVSNSNRQAAIAVHRHHSTIPARLDHAENVLQFPLNTPAGRFRLHLALILRRLRDNPADDEDG